MGYNTRFTGVLKFTHELSVPQLARLNEVLGEDPNEKGLTTDRNVGYIDLETTKDLTGLQWSHAEKTYYLERSVNLVLEYMRKEFPEFGLNGSLLAQGDDIEDRWQLVIGDDGRAAKVKVPIPGTKIECPHCHQKFYHQGSPVNGTENGS